MPDGKVGHDAFAVIRETIRSMNKVAIGRVVLTNREHIIALEPLDKGLMGTLLRYPYEVRSEKEYFDDIQDVKITKDMLDLAKHIVEQKSGVFEPEKFEDHYEIRADRSDQPEAQRRKLTAPRPRRRSSGNVINLMDALKRSLAGEKQAAPRRQGPRRGQRQEAEGGRGPARDAAADRRQRQAAEAQEAAKRLRSRCAKKAAKPRARRRPVAKKAG